MNLLILLETSQQRDNDFLPEYEEELSLVSTCKADQMDVLRYYGALKLHMSKMYSFDCSKTPKKNRNIVKAPREEIEDFTNGKTEPKQIPFNASFRMPRLGSKLSAEQAMEKRRSHLSSTQLK